MSKLERQHEAPRAPHARLAWFTGLIGVIDSALRGRRDDSSLKGDGEPQLAGLPMSEIVAGLDSSLVAHVADERGVDLHRVSDEVYVTIPKQTMTVDDFIKAEGGDPQDAELRADIQNFIAGQSE